MPFLPELHASPAAADGPPSYEECLASDPYLVGRPAVQDMHLPAYSAPAEEYPVVKPPTYDEAMRINAI